jgi:hypothetical protein
MRQGSVENKTHELVCMRERGGCRMLSNSSWENVNMIQLFKGCVILYQWTQPTAGQSRAKRDQLNIEDKI